MTNFCDKCGRTFRHGIVRNYILFTLIQLLACRISIFVTVA